jgi:cytochrome c553
MKRLIMFATVFCVMSPPASATGDAAAGEAQTAACAACHGQDGNSAVGAFPKLAGQNQRYLAKQLQDIQSGVRPVPQMAGQTDNMSEQDMQNIGAFYESKTITVGQAKPELVELGERIYRGGIADKGVSACTGCHSPTGQGNGPAGFPALGGQHAEYIAAQLKAFRTGADQPEKGRVNDGESRMMRSTAALLSDLEIEAVASYISGLHP